VISASRRQAEISRRTRVAGAPLLGVLPAGAGSGLLT